MNWIPLPGLTKDHAGKASQGRVSALIGIGVASVLGLAPLWGGPDPSIEVLLVFIGGPSGLCLWQKGISKQEGA